MCTHELWTMKEYVISDGRKTFREFCVGCGISNGGTNLGLSLPVISDNDLIIGSFKYKGMTLGDIAKIDKEYIRWIVIGSKCKSREKKAAARVYFGQPFIPPRVGDVYPKEKIYDPAIGVFLINKLIHDPS